MNDTHPKIEKELQRRFSLLSGTEKVEMACSMYDFAKELVRANIVNNNPSATEKEIKKQIFIRFYGQDLSPEQIQNYLNSDLL